MIAFGFRVLAIDRVGVDLERADSLVAAGVHFDERSDQRYVADWGRATLAGSSLLVPLAPGARSHTSAGYNPDQQLPVETIWS